MGGKRKVTIADLDDIPISELDGLTIEQTEDIDVINEIRKRLGLNIIE